jgi:predicted ATPase
VIAHLAGRDLLLVLDNCEHLVDACAVLVDTLVLACPGLRVLATGRQSLGIDGEVTLPVPPLPVPGGTAAAVRGCSAATGEARPVRGGNSLIRGSYQ